MASAVKANNMKPIAKAEWFKYQFKFIIPYKLSYGTLDGADNIIVKLTDSDGYVGWGEADLLKPFTDKSSDEAMYALRDFTPFLVKVIENPEPAFVNKLAGDKMPGHEAAKGAIIMALLDIKGKRQGKRVCELLGPVIHSMLPVLWPLGNGTAAEDMKVIDEKMKEGYTTFMLKMGGQGVSIAGEIKRVQELEAHYGERVNFIPDANAGWTMDQAKEFMEGVKDARIAFLEQPVAKADLDGMAELTATGLVKISADESLTGPASAKTIIERGIANVLSIKSSKNGGPIDAKAISDLAETAGLSCYFNSMLELGITQAASLHHAATVKNLDPGLGHAYMSALRLRGDPTNFASLVKNGMVYLPTGPGLGIEVDEEKVRKGATLVMTTE
jgi:muconate cycloisomerase